MGHAGCETDRRKWRPVRLIDAGVRIFEAGVEGDVEQGKDRSRGAKRREARQPRRQQWRRQQRKRRLFTLLQKHELLPPSENNRSENRNANLVQQYVANWQKSYLPIESIAIGFAAQRVRRNGRGHRYHFRKEVVQFALQTVR